MIKLTTDATISETPANIKKKDTDLMPTQQAAVVRPDVVDAKVYKLRSAFVKNSVFVTLSYINEGEWKYAPKALWKEKIRDTNKDTKKEEAISKSKKKKKKEKS